MPTYMSGERFRCSEGSSQNIFSKLRGPAYCRHGCAACVDACPEQVPIAEVLRTRMYATDYGDLELAREDYAALGTPADACAGCTHRACLGACPIGLEIPGLTAATHRLLA